MDALLNIFFNNAPHAHLPAPGLRDTGSTRLQLVLRLMASAPVAAPLGGGGSSDAGAGTPVVSAGESSVTPLLRLLGNLSAVQEGKVLCDHSSTNFSAFLGLLHQLLVGISSLCFGNPESLSRVGVGCRQLIYHLKDLLWLLGNLLAIPELGGRPECAGLLEVLLQLLCVCSEYSVQKEVVIALNNALLVPLPTGLVSSARTGVSGWPAAALLMSDRYRPALVEMRDLLSTPRTTDTGLLIVLMKLFYKLATCTAGASQSPNPEDMEWLCLVCHDLGVLDLMEELSCLEDGLPLLCDTAVACVDSLYQFLQILEDEGEGEAADDDEGGYYGPACGAAAAPATYGFGLPQDSSGSSQTVFDFSK